MHSKKKIDNYIILLDKCLGEGSYGKVYEGQHQVTKTRVAVKMLDKKTVEKDDYIKKALFEEIKILGSLKSKNIVGFEDVMESSNYYYIVQELCTGGDLRRIMDKKGKIPELEAVDMLKQICNGFVVMLKQGIIHRDLKPENILMSDGLLKICDFGFSKRLDTNKMKNKTVVGTPLYMSLQILKSQAYTGKCDIWALGFIFYEMLHGCTPWTAKSEYQLIQNVQSKPLRINEKLSDNVKSVLQKMLKLQEKQRISWDDLLRHPVFGNYFSEYITMNQTFENKMKSIMNQLRYVIKSSNIDLERLFASRGYSKNSELTLQDFRKFLTVVGLSIEMEECRYAFQKIDTDDSNTISLHQLENTLMTHMIPLNSVVGPKFSKKASINSQGYQNNTLAEQFQDKVQLKLVNSFKKLDQRMTKNSIQLFQVYDAYDINKDGDMTTKEFSRILKKLDETFTEEEIAISFKIVDISGNGSISFEEFNKYFCKCVGIAVKAQGKSW